MVPLLLAAALVPQAPLSVQTLHPERGPTVLVHHQTSPLAALRLSVPVDADLPEGTVELLQELARQDAEGAARRFGARLELRHEDGRAVIAVTGPATAFDALAGVLRRAVGEPDLAVASLRRARARAEDRVLARLEQPDPRIRRRLRRALYGGPDPDGAPATVVDPESVRRLRSRLYDPSRTRVVVVAPVAEVVVRSAFSYWPPGGPVPGPVEADSAEPQVRAQAHREWGGLAFPVEADPVALDVTAELVRQRLIRAPLPFGDVRVWHTPTPALALIGAALPGDSVIRTMAGIVDLPVRDDSMAVPAVGPSLRRLVAEAAALTSPQAVAEARATIRRRLLLDARSAAGMAEVIGRTADAHGDAMTPAAFLDRIADVGPADVRAILALLLETPAVAAEAR